MADTIGKVAVAPKAEVDKSTWEWVTVPAKDLFGDSHTGVSINFRKFTPKLDEEGQPTGEEGKYFVDPDSASEVRRLLAQYHQAQMRIMQRQPDLAMAKVMNRGSKLGAPVHADKF
jgi:hypothetical protein